MSEAGWRLITWSLYGDMTLPMQLAYLSAKLLLNADYFKKSHSYSQLLKASNCQHETQTTTVSLRTCRAGALTNR
jgi:hypothetical protein